MTAYYNEFDPQTAAWLRVLIAEGHIAPGVVDERSIEDVRPSDLDGFAQCHFFAGIGVWSYALRRAGWRDDRPIWTGSCPCQPFSAAGKGAGFDDERHLWPHFQWLIQERKPAIVLGEQVASAAVDDWIDLVHTDLETLGYAFGSVPFPAASVGAPHIRDRNYWAAISGNRRDLVSNRDVPDRLANANDSGRQRGRPGQTSDGRVAARQQPERLRYANRMADMQSDGCEGQSLRASGGLQAVGASDIGSIGRMADDDQHGRIAPSIAGVHDAEYHAEPCGGTGGMGNSDSERIRTSGFGEIAETTRGMQSEDGKRKWIRVDERPSGSSLSDAKPTAGPTNGYWADADWLHCRDGKWRPVESGTFPLAHGAPARVVRLRGYGNAVNAEQARAWIETVMECLP